MKTTIFYYVNDMHGASILKSGRLLKTFKTIPIDNFNEDDTLKEFIEACNKTVPQLGVMKVVARIIEKRDNTVAKVQIEPVLEGTISKSKMTFIKQRVIDNHNVLSVTKTMNIPEENKFVLNNVQYEFTVQGNELN